MNKIYKLIWSKVRNCYVAVSEIAKRNGKGGGAVVGGAKGRRVRGELGLRMDATKDNPWKADISIYGYGGKHRGFGGNVSVAYTF